jgi:signal transduction histidine kinase
MTQTPSQTRSQTLSETSSNGSQPGDQPGVVAEPIAVEKLPELFSAVPLLSRLSPEDLHCFEGAELVHAQKGTAVVGSGVGRMYFWVMLSGLVRAYKEKDGTRVYLMDFKPGETAGEVPLLMGERNPTAYCETVEDAVMVRVGEGGFWRLMSTCPRVRAGILENMTHRFSIYQAITLHREKLVSLGTLAAGLMHELNNPGAAARRAASQLRENMTRLQTLSLKLTRAAMGPDQLECLAGLQERVFTQERPAALDSLEQSDQEEALSEWLEELGVENPWRLAPTLVSIGWRRDDIGCAQASFAESGGLSDALNYIEALISNVQLVGTVEESITRVTDLVTAVKKYAYDDKTKRQAIDVRDSLGSTLTILGHKFRHKQLQVKTQFAEVAPVSCVGAGLNQVWTNLLDNAIDAAPEGSTVHVRLWQEGDQVCVGIADEGPGIAPEHWPRIFEPFYTTKELGVGTGLGLDIVHRIVVNHFSGEVTFATEPGHTEFVVRLPVGKGASCTVGAAK